MTALNTATKLYLGAQPVDAVYLGADKVWQAVTGDFSPDDLAGLTIWLDASRLGLADGAAITSMTNFGTGPTPTVLAGTTPITFKANTLNGLPVMRFAFNGARVRGTWTSDVYEWTVIYIVRLWGANVGRAFSAQYPPSNFLIGMHTSKMDAMYDNGTWLGGTSWPGPGPLPWRTYGGDSHGGYGSRFFLDGVQQGAVASGVGGLSNGWSLSGYDDGTNETMDIDVSELLIYDRKLSDADRKQVEAYLHEKWFVQRYDPDTVAYLTATGLDPSYAPAVDGLVVGLKSHGLWTKMKAVYPFVGGTAALHKWNLIDPRDVDAAYRLTFYGGGVSIHSTALGYRANPAGATVNGPGYADTHLVPLGALTQNSLHLAFYGLEDTPAADRAEIGCYAWGGGQERFHLIARYQGVNSFYYGMSESGGSSVPVPSSSGLFVGTRNSSSSQEAYRNGVSLTSSAMPSVGLPTVPVWVGAINFFQNKTDIPCGFVSIGAGLTAQNVADLYTVVQAFQTALGRQV